MDKYSPASAWSSACMYEMGEKGGAWGSNAITSGQCWWRQPPALIPSPNVPIPFDLPAGSILRAGRWIKLLLP